MLTYCITGVLAAFGIYNKEPSFNAGLSCFPNQGIFCSCVVGFGQTKTTRPRQPWEQPDRDSGPQETQTTEILESLISHIRTLQFPSDFGGGAAYCNCNLLHSLVLQQHSSCSWALVT